MTDEEFATYLPGAVASYAESHVRAKNWTADEALRRSEEEFAELLPDGVHTEGHHVFTARDGDQPVGMLWFAERNNGRTAYLYDIRLDADQQGHGYGEAVMHALEETVRAKGIRVLRLHVFAHNTVARSLYRKLGYEETNIVMTKLIAD
jgi:ribosomal protein S18 acetylase RimI-like enzyme